MAKHFEKVNDADMTADPARRRYNEMDLSTQQSTARKSACLRMATALAMAGRGARIRRQHGNRFSFINTAAGKTLMAPVADMDVYGAALFGQATWTPVDRLHLTAGLRLDHQQMDGEVEDSAKAASCSDELTYDEVLPKAVIAYDITPETMTYASVASRAT